MSKTMHVVKVGKTELDRFYDQGEAIELVREYNQDISNGMEKAKTYKTTSKR